MNMNEIHRVITYTYYCDGGISSKLSPDPNFPCYGSYRQCKIIHEMKDGHKPLLKKEWGEEIWMVHKNNIFTSNMSEFATLINLLKIIRENHIPEDSITIIMDSKIVLESLAGNYKIKNPNIKDLLQQTHLMLASCLCKISFEWISGKTMKTILTH